MNNKAFTYDIYIWVIFLFVFCLFAVITFVFMSSLNAEIQAETNGVSETAKQDLSRNVSVMPSWIDGVVALLLGGGIILMVLSTFYLQDTPVLFFLTWIFLVVVIIVSAGLSNAFYEFGSEDSISAGLSSFIVIPWVGNNLPLVAVMLGVSLLIGLFLKSRSG